MLRREREFLGRERKLFERGKDLSRASKMTDNRNDKRTFTIHEISESLPEFRPMDLSSGSAPRFIKRIRDLQSVYEWDDKLLLFASQSRLREKRYCV